MATSHPGWLPVTSCDPTETSAAAPDVDDSHGHIINSHDVYYHTMHALG
jgi:hypothetical protein